MTLITDCWPPLRVLHILASENNGGRQRNNAGYSMDEGCNLRNDVAHRYVAMSILTVFRILRSELESDPRS